MKLMSSIIKETNEFDINAQNDNKESEQMILDMLYKRYAEEILQWYHYWTVAPFLCGDERPSIENKFSEFADDELNDHAAKLLKRIDELNGDIETLKNLDTLKVLSECKYISPEKPYDTVQLLQINIEHEKCAIEGYKNLCEISKDIDPVTYDIAVEMLKDEEEHLNELENFLADRNMKH